MRHGGKTRARLGSLAGQILIWELAGHCRGDLRRRGVRSHRSGGRFVGVCVLVISIVEMGCPELVITEPSDDLEEAAVQYLPPFAPPPPPHVVCCGGPGTGPVRRVLPGGAPPCLGPVGGVAHGGEGSACVLRATLRNILGPSVTGHKEYFVESASLRYVRRAVLWVVGIAKVSV